GATEFKLQLALGARQSSSFSLLFEPEFNFSTFQPSNLSTFNPYRARRPQLLPQKKSRPLDPFSYICSGNRELLPHIVATDVLHKMQYEWTTHLWGQVPQRPAQPCLHFQPQQCFLGRVSSLARRLNLCGP